MSSNPIVYWRATQHWSKLIGQTALVLLATTIYSSAANLQVFTPYQLLVVAIGKQRYTVMATADCQTEIKPGDQVRLVLRKISIDDSKQIINYGLKGQKI